MDNTGQVAGVFDVDLKTTQKNSTQRKKKAKTTTRVWGVRNGEDGKCQLTPLLSKSRETRPTAEPSEKGGGGRGVKSFKS